MADIDDVTTALASLISGAIYPSGTGSPSVTGAPTRAYPGWPVPSNLDSDLAGGTVNVSLFPTTERVEPVINLNAEAVSIAPATLTLTLSGATITVGGTISTPQTVMVAINKKPYTYAVQATDTLATVASGIAAAIGGTASGAVVTVPAGTFQINTGISTQAQMVQPQRRTSRMIQITVWAPSPALRTATAKALDLALSQAERMTLPDGTSCALMYRSSPMVDAVQKQGIYRRDVIYESSFLATVETQAQTVTSLSTNLTGGNAPVQQFNIL